MILSDFINQLKNDADLGPQVTYHHYLSPENPEFGNHEHMSSPTILELIKKSGIERLYSHQVNAIEKLKNGKDIIISTPTASGKSLVYNIPVIDEILKNPAARALYIFPLKALEQDQMKNLNDLILSLQGVHIAANIYDGDTSPADRKMIKNRITNIIITNPDMLHRGILAYHENWSEFFSHLSFVVIDEVHTYRGIFGSHLAQIIRRLKRICLHYNTMPRFILSSATIQNPDDFGKRLTGKDVEVISKNGAPKFGRHFIFINPELSSSFLATQLFIKCLKCGLRTIAFAKSRKVTELINIRARQFAPDLKNMVSSYRAGFLPNERRLIENRLARGKLLGVISTSALEMGIDIGYLDVCILVGYPGTIINTWQRGGRVGRSGRESIIAMIADPDALDQYFIKHPAHLFEQSFEAATIDPENEHIIRAHLPCAAEEMPLTKEDIRFWGTNLTSHCEILESEGKLRRTVEGEEKWFSAKKRPHLNVNIRSVGETFTIFRNETGEAIGTIDGIRALKECHNGAIYLHMAKTYFIEQLLIDKKDIIATETDLKYFTRIKSDKETEILETIKSQPKGQFVVKLGRLKVTETITGYEKRRIPGQELIGVFSLDLPPQIFETIGLWVEIEPVIKQMVEDKGLHFMGGIHAIEHSAIGIFPLFALCDRNDIGGISYTFHPEVGKPAIFIYDGYPGGVGLAQRGFDIILELLTRTLGLIRDCPCEEGCPSCIYSPKCGSGNKPLDKKAAILVLEALTGILSFADMPPLRIRKDTTTAYKNMPTQSEGPRKERIIYLDLETQKSAQEVGGWQNTHLMLLSVAVIFDDIEDKFYTFTEDQVDKLIEHLLTADLIIGFNNKRFDYRVLAPYTNQNIAEMPSFDILEDIYNRLGFRLSLDHLVWETLGRKKSADGLKALEWFKNGETEKIIAYCKNDVQITKDLFIYGIKNGHLIYRDKRQDERVRLLVDWEIDKMIKRPL